MKLAFFHNLPSGGAKRVLFEQIKYLSKKHTIDVYELCVSEKDFIDTKDLSCTIYSIPFEIIKKPHNPLSSFIADFKNFVLLASVHRKLADRINKGGYDFIIVHPDKYTQAPFLLRYLTTKNLYYCHEWLRIVYEKQFAFTKKVSLPKHWYELLTRSIRKKIDLENTNASYIIAANSLFTASHIREAYGRKALVCSPGVDISVFYPKTEKKKYDLLFVGEENEVEGFTLLEEVLKLFPKKPVVKILSAREKKNWLTDTELASEYRKAKIVVALSRNEPFGLIPLEAMACGTPVIALNEGGYKETIKNGVIGYLVSPQAEHIFKAIDALLQNEKLRQKMGRDASLYIKKEWTWELKNKELQEIIKDE